MCSKPTPFSGSVLGIVAGSFCHAATVQSGYGAHPSPQESPGDRSELSLSGNAAIKAGTEGGGQSLGWKPPARPQWGQHPLQERPARQLQTCPLVAHLQVLHLCPWSHGEGLMFLLRGRFEAVPK